MAEVGNALGAGEDAARKRVSRALEKLHRYFSKRGVASTTATIAEKISANSVQAAPVALAKSVTAVAIAKGAAASASTLTLIKGALKIMAWTKAKTAIVVGAGVLLAVGTTTITIKEIKLNKARQYVVARAPWRDLSAATPLAAVQTFTWAVVNGKYDRAEALMQWEETGSHDNVGAILCPPNDSDNGLGSAHHRD